MTGSSEKVMTNETTHTQVMTAETAFENGMGAWGLQKNKNGIGVVLYDAVLVEDDGPGAGGGGTPNKYKAVMLDLVDPVRAKKILHVENPQFINAWLAIRLNHFEGKEKGISIELNGTPLASQPDANGLWPIAPGALKKGDNEVILYCQGNNGRRISVAVRQDILNNAPERQNWPGRSFTSIDHGKTWAPVDGEFYVRLMLQQSVGEGHMISPVIDLGKEQYDDSVLSATMEVRQAELAWKADVPEGTKVSFSVRTGSSPVFEAAQWSDWKAVNTGTPARHRYMQWKAILATANPLVTPVLTGVTVNSKVIYQQPAWAKNVGVTEFNNEEIRYTSIPYAYEDFNNTRLKELRRKYRLDDVVRGAKSELEKMAKLRNWVNQQWKWCPPAEPYPAWDSHVLLERKNGFCVHFAIVMMQCAISLGHQARFVFGMHPLVSGGHEVCEVWSNEYKKWMFIDGADNIHHTDPTTKAPLSMLEVHDRLLKVCYGEQVAGPATRPRPQDVRNADDITTCYGLNLAPHLPPEDHKQFERRRPWAYWFLFRMVPRNNFFSQEYPVPKTQGISWDWTGYWLWEDRQTPRGWQYCYHNYTSRRSDLLWTINQVRFSAEYGTRPGLLDIRLGTVTPGLDSFQVNIDNKGWSKTKARFFWALHQGKNRIEMRVRNQAGICGPVSFVEVNYKKTAVANKKTIKARPQRRKSKITKRKRG